MQTKLSASQIAKIAEYAVNAPVAVLEFRGQKVDLKKWTSKDNGKPAEMWINTIAAEFVETGRQIALEITNPKGETAPLQELPIQKGAIVLATFRDYEESFKGTTARVLSLVPLSELELPKPPAKP